MIAMHAKSFSHARQQWITYFTTVLVFLSEFQFLPPNDVSVTLITPPPMLPSFRYFGPSILMDVCRKKKAKL
jgi:hypothetical protein